MRKIGKSKANSERVLRPLPLVNFLTQTAALSSGLRCLRSVNYPVTVIVFRSRALVELGEEFVEVCINDGAVRFPSSSRGTACRAYVEEKHAS